MDSNTIGVISTPDGRSSRDLQMMQNFSCKRPGQNGARVIGDGTVVLGSDIEERSSRDKQMLSTFSCSRESYVGPDGMIYPRSEKDQAMLKEFNACPCKEQFQYHSGHYYQKDKLYDRNRRDKARESYCGCGCGGNCGGNCGCGPSCPSCSGTKEDYCGCAGGSGGNFNTASSCGPNCQGNNPIARLNFNPYNSSSSITYVPLGRGLQ